MNLILKLWIRVAHFKNSYVVLTFFQVQIQFNSLGGSSFPNRVPLLKIDWKFKLTLFQVQIQILWILFKILKIDRKLDIV